MHDRGMNIPSDVRVQFLTDGTVSLVFPPHSSSQVSLFPWALGTRSPSSSPRWARTPPKGSTSCTKVRTTGTDWYLLYYCNILYCLFTCLHLCHCSFPTLYCNWCATISPGINQVISSLILKHQKRLLCTHIKSGQAPVHTYHYWQLEDPGLSVHSSASQLCSI